MTDDARRTCSGKHHCCTPPSQLQVRGKLAARLRTNGNRHGGNIKGTLQLWHRPTAHSYEQEPRPHQDNLQAAFYKEIERELRRVYSTLPPTDPDYSPNGDLPPHREVIWAADHNSVTNSKLDAIPAHSSPPHPRAAEQRQILRTYLRDQRRLPSAPPRREGNLAHLRGAIAPHRRH